MSAALIAVALVLLLNVAAGLVVVARAVLRREAMLAALLFGSTGVAIFVVLAGALGAPRALDVALAMALLAAVLGVALVVRGWPAEGRS